MKLAEIFNRIGTLPYLADSSNVSLVNDFRFVSEYLAHANDIDRLIFKKYSNLKMNHYYEDIQNSSEWYNEINSILYSFQKEINAVYDALFIDYNPVHNYDKTSEIKHTYSEVVTKNELGERVNTSNITPNSVTTTSEVAAFNSNDFQNSNKSTIENSLQTATNTSEPATDVSTTSEHTLEDVERTVGNIGVTTTQEMIQSELSLRFNHSFYIYLIDLIFGILTTEIWEV